METAFLVMNGTITADTPIHLGDGRHFGIIKQTRPYISGAILRGAVGIALIKTICQNPEYVRKHEGCPIKEECPYFQLYQDVGNKASRIIFRNAYPKHRGCANNGTYVPAPRTLFTCEKYHERHNTYNPPLTCSKCGDRIRPFEGYICTSCQHIDRLPVKIQRKTATAVDRKKCSAAVITPIPGEEGYGTLHSRDMLPKDTEYDFTLIFHREAESHIDLLVNILEKALPDEGIGGGKSRGFGKVSAKVDGVEKITSEMLDKRAETIDTDDFSVRLISDAIIKKPSLPPATLLSAARRAYTWAYRQGAPALPEVALKEKLASFNVTSGWSIRENKRRDILPAIAAGSVFRYHAEKSELLAKALAALEYLAIGRYKPHGYGQIKIEEIQ